MGVHRAELVVAHLADERGASTQGRNPGRGVGGGATRCLQRGAHVAVDRRGLRRVHQLHRGLRQPVGRQEGVIFMREDVDDGVAQSDDVEVVVAPEALSVSSHGRRK